MRMARQKGVIEDAFLAMTPVREVATLFPVQVVVVGDVEIPAFLFHDAEQVESCAGGLGTAQNALFQVGDEKARMGEGTVCSVGIDK